MGGHCPNSRWKRPARNSLLGERPSPSTHQQRPGPEFRHHPQRLDFGYEVNGVINAADYGMPQQRSRSFLLTAHRERQENSKNQSQIRFLKKPQGPIAAWGLGVRENLEMGDWSFRQAFP